MMPAMPLDVWYALSQHQLADPRFVHTNLDHSLCVCAHAEIVNRPPPSTGNACYVCGGITVPTGSCDTCTECGATGGCG